MWPQSLWELLGMRRTKPASPAGPRPLLGPGSGWTSPPWLKGEVDCRLLLRRPLTPGSDAPLAATASGLHHRHTGSMTGGQAVRRRQVA